MRHPWQLEIRRSDLLLLFLFPTILLTRNLTLNLNLLRLSLILRPIILLDTVNNELPRTSQQTV
jgi:hypothetical protein